MKHLTLGELADQATIVVQAKVTGAESAWDAARAGIWTHYSLDVSTTFKGSYGNDDPVAHGRGGQVGNQVQSVSGEPTLSTGSEYLLFLQKNDAGMYRMLGKSQGIFTIARPEGGAATASNSFTGIQVVGSDGKQVAEKVGRISEELDTLRSKLEAHLKPDDKKADDAPGQGETAPAPNAPPAAASKPEAAAVPEEGAE